jgi:hypothetical protein
MMWKLPTITAPSSRSIAGRPIDSPPRNGYARLPPQAPACERSSGSALAKEWLVREEFLTVDLAPFLRSVHQRLA